MNSNSDIVNNILKDADGKKILSTAITNPANKNGIYIFKQFVNSDTKAFKTFNEYFIINDSAEAISVTFNNDKVANSAIYEDIKQELYSFYLSLTNDTDRELFRLSLLSLLLNTNKGNYQLRFIIPLSILSEYIENNKITNNDINKLLSNSYNNEEDKERLESILETYKDYINKIESLVNSTLDDNISFTDTIIPVEPITLEDVNTETMTNRSDEEQENIDNTNENNEKINLEQQNQNRTNTLTNEEQEQKFNEIEFETSHVEGYSARTRENASADATIHIAADFTTPDEKLTITSVIEQNKVLMQLGIETHEKFKVTQERVDKIVDKLNSIIAKIPTAAKIPHNQVSGEDIYGYIQEANEEAKRLLGKTPYAIDMIDVGVRYRTTRRRDAMKKYNVKVGNIVTMFGKSANGTTKYILAKITAIHPIGTPEYISTWHKEGWTKEGVNVIKNFGEGSAAIEFEVIKPSITLNIAGNGIYTLKDYGYTQQQIDEFVYDLLKAVISSPKLNVKIGLIRSGGQTGVDEAGAKAGARLGIKTFVLAPKYWAFRDINNRDIKDEQLFKQRFVTTKNEEQEQIQEEQELDFNFNDVEKYIPYSAIYSYYKTTGTYNIKTWLNYGIDKKALIKNVRKQMNNKDLLFEKYKYMISINIFNDNLPDTEFITDKSLYLDMVDLRKSLYYANGYKDDLTELLLILGIIKPKNIKC